MDLYSCERPIVGAISLIDVLTLTIKVDKLKEALIYLVSFSAGALFGGAFLHLLPELVEEGGFTIQISFLILGGIVLFFFTEKIREIYHLIMDKE